MKKVLTISVEPEEKALKYFKEGFLNAWETGEEQGKYIYFTSPAILFKKITPKRWELMAALQMTNPISIRELARLLNRDIRRVHDDVTALINEGIIEKRLNGICIPYDEIHTDFILKSKAA